jgi:hypothetical protein
MPGLILSMSGTIVPHIDRIISYKHLTNACYNAADFFYTDNTIISKGSEIEDRKRIHRRPSGETHR